LLSRKLVKADRAPALMAKAAQARVATLAVRADALPTGTHLVQLGAFSTQEGAHRAWRHYLAVNPALKGYRPVITAATVNGKQFWRTQAAGFASAAPRARCVARSRPRAACASCWPTRSPAAQPLPLRSALPATGDKAERQRSSAVAAWHHGHFMPRCCAVADLRLA
jgi:hypothetical protein